MIESLITLACIFAYGIIGGLSMGFLKGMQELDDVAPVVGGALWPIGLPLAIGYIVARRFARWLDGRRKAKEEALKAAAQRVYPAPESPTYRDPPEKAKP